MGYLHGRRLTAGSRTRAAVASVCALVAAAVALPTCASALGDPPTYQIPLPLAPEAASYDLALDDRGVLYIASEHEVLVYDGQRWERIAVPDNLVVRSLATGPQGQIYVGGFDHFGVIARDAFGRLAYQDWSARLPAGEARDFEDIWQTRSDAQHVYFRALHRVFGFDHAGQHGQVWRSEGRFGAIAFIDGELWLQWRGEGLKRLQGTEFTMVPGGEQFADTLIYYLWTHPQGGQVAISQRPQLQWLHDGRVTPLTLLPAQAPPSALTAHKQLSSQVAVSGMQDGHVLEMDFAQSRTSISSVSNDWISGLVADVHGDLWTVDDEMLTHVQLNSPWRLLDAADGLRGTLADLIEFHGDWYGLSGAGVYVAREVARGSPHFERLDLPVGEAWSMVADGEDLLLAESYAIWRLHPGAPARAVTDNRLYPRLLRMATSPARRLYVATESGVSVIDLDRGDTPLPGAVDLGARVDTLIELAPGRLLAGTQTRGLFEVRVAADGSGVARAIDAQSGIHYGQNPSANVMALGQEIFAVTAAGVFRWTDERFVADSLDGLGALLPRNGTLPVIVSDQQGQFWALSAGRVFYRGKQHWRELAAPPGTGPSLRNLFVVGDGRVVFGATSRLLTYDLTRAERNPPATTVEWHRAWQELAGKRQALPLATDRLGTLPARAALRVQFSAPAMSGQIGVRFRARVVPLDGRWSSWSPVAEISLGAMAPGKMRLEVQARSGNAPPGPVRSLDFEVAPLWHERLDTRLLLVGLLIVFGGLATAGLTRWRVKRLRARNDRLEEIVHARTEALEQANVQLRAQSLRDGLTGIANRRGFDNALREAWRRALIERTPLAVLMIDADHFKAYNDRHGHLRGDELLCALATEIARADGRDRLTARWGGEEFAVLMAGTDLGTASREAARIHERVQALALGVSVSVGVAATVPVADAAAELLVAAADGALYAAKAAGRDRVVTGVVPGA